VRLPVRDKVFWDPPRTGQERVDVFGHLDVREVTVASQHVLTNVEGERDFDELS